MCFSPSPPPTPSPWCLVSPARRGAEGARGGGGCSGCRPAGGRVSPAAGCLPPAQTGFWKVLCLAGCILGRVMWSPVMSWDQSLTQLRVPWMGVRRYQSAGLRCQSPPGAGRPAPPAGEGLSPVPPESPALPLPPGKAWLLLQEGRKSQLEYYNGSALAPGGRLSRDMEASLHAGCGGPFPP